MTEITKIETETQHLPADPMVSMIERVAMDPNVPIERLERMMDLKDRHDEGIRRDRAEHARQAFNTAMSRAQSEMPTVVKSKKNDHTRSTYADLSDIEEQAMPIAYKHGFSVSFTPAGTDERGNLLIDWCVMHEDGHTRQGQAGFPLDGAGAQGKANKTGIQAMGSTMTYARRYLICNLFNIATDDDTDGNGANRPEPEQPRRSTDPWTQTIIEEMPENATPREKAEAIADALCAQFGRMKGARQLGNEWDRRVHLIEGEKGFQGKHPDLWERVIDAYENRMNEINGQD